MYSNKYNFYKKKCFIIFHGSYLMIMTLLLMNYSHLNLGSNGVEVRNPSNVFITTPSNFHIIFVNDCTLKVVFHL